MNYIFIFMISSFYTFVTVTYSISMSDGTILDHCKIDLALLPVYVPKVKFCQRELLENVRTK